jgi:hypothetical protein
MNVLHCQGVQIRGRLSVSLARLPTSLRWVCECARVIHCAQLVFVANRSTADGSFAAIDRIKYVAPTLGQNCNKSPTTSVQKNIGPRSATDIASCNQLKCNFAGTNTCSYTPSDANLWQAQNSGQLHEQ